ncbi:MAG: LysR family transcriptional regulator [Pseudomonadota bacterium]
MDSRFVRSLLAVIDTGSIAAAARSEGITASALAQRIEVLETMAGRQLLVRAGRGMAPTSACAALIELMRGWVTDGVHLLSAMQAGSVSGPFRVGAVATAMVDLVPGIVRRAARDLPDVSFEFHPGTSRDLYQRLETRAIDAALVVSPPFAMPKAVRFYPLMQAGIARVGPIGDVPHVLYDRAAWGGKACWKALKEIRPDPRIMCEMDSLPTIAALVAQGIGASVLPLWSEVTQALGSAQVDMLDAPALEIGLAVSAQMDGHPGTALIRSTVS